MEESTEVPDFNSIEEYQEWVNSEDWYQTIWLREGMVTKGKFRTDDRLPLLRGLQFAGKRVLDIGCNSGQYSLYASAMGARDVVGIDVDTNRIRQARTLARNEGLNAEFHIRGLDEVADFGQFDIVLCFAVLTEIENVLGALRTIREVTGERAILEMGLAKPVGYLSRNRSWWKRDQRVSRKGRTAELRRHRHAGWVMFPTLEIIADLFGDEFIVRHEGIGLRYDRVTVERKASS